MGLLGRVFHGVTRALTAPLRAMAAPFMFVANMLKTGLDVLGKLAQGDLFGAFGTAVKGTIGNCVKLGVNLVEGGNPLLAFAHGFASQNGLSFN